MTIDIWAGADGVPPHAQSTVRRGSFLCSYDSQVHSATYRLTYNPNMFDDQYIGCSDKLEKYIMPKVLQKEKTNKQFKEAWINATELWEEIKDNLDLPEGFEDEYGVALLIFTNKYPEENPIYQQLNGNLTIAGASRIDYMEKFHFKALHFYLTRALQMLKPNCEESYVTYRGSQHSIHVHPVFRFGRFTSASLTQEVAHIFGTESFFKITTCFGAKVDNFSFFPSEEEVLIPPTEKFLYIKKQNSVYILQSTGQMCSYFNCAYLEAEKREVAVCRSDTHELEEETKEENEKAMKMTTMSPVEMEERLKVLEDQISQIHEYRNDDQAYTNEILTALNEIDNSQSVARLGALVEEGLTELEKKILHLVSRHEELLASMQEVEIFQEDLTELKNKILHIVLRHDELLASMQEKVGILQGLTELKKIIPHIVSRHDELLASMQEKVGILQGIFVLLITLLVIVGFTTICSNFFNWM
ncbi:ecto-ADP-ribosyltransferase 5-like isoform X3 [Bufo bufo]|uniref:ecto-ADP-ribosyltransferase 5-like isoform X3 n=1 Tax=Bufo bufo TaxID=8384 RepID=UPI001ABDFC05|nr:ecto-ADP-ribosyltransferase 5-like isoform X3 [Bufo bufo]